MCAGVTIGFNQTNYSVGESHGEVFIGIGVTEGILRRELTINISTYSQTASGKLTSDVDIDFYFVVTSQCIHSADYDYEEWNDFSLTFDRNHTFHTVNISIVPSDEAEVDEIFTVSLSFTGKRVSLHPSNATVSILELIGESKEFFIPACSYCISMTC